MEEKFKTHAAKKALEAINYITEQALTHASYVKDDYMQANIEAHTITLCDFVRLTTGVENE